MENEPFIGFNKPYITGKETGYILEAVNRHQLSGDGYFTSRCHQLLKDRFGFTKPLFTNSCTDALEMAALLLDIRPGDEVIMPSYTFVSTANAFALRGAEIKFADSGDYHPNVSVNEIEKLITPATRAIVPVHYAGVACDMDSITDLASAKGIAVVEDAAQAINSFYKGRPLGSLGSAGAFSFHETKNVISGEGGMITINDPALFERAETIREKGTNRSAFRKGETDKYTWVDIGSSYQPGEIMAAFLYAQLENIDDIQKKRSRIWETYERNLKSAGEQFGFRTPVIPEYSSNNSHIYYLICRSTEERKALIAHLASKNIQAIFHYQALHESPYFLSNHKRNSLPNSTRYTDCLVRLPLFNELTEAGADRISHAVIQFYSGR